MAARMNSDTPEIRSRRGRGSRAKGQVGERELFGLLSQKLGLKVSRRLDATRGGGCDTWDIPGWSVEVKRCETYQSAFWTQTLDQARADHNRPVLFWRKSRMRWIAMIDPHDFRPDIWPEPGVHGPLQMDWEDWCKLCRGTL